MDTFTNMVRTHRHGLIETCAHLEPDAAITFMNTMRKITSIHSFLWLSTAQVLSALLFIQDGKGPLSRPARRIAANLTKRWAQNA
jgi:hypothetical protein